MLTGKLLRFKFMLPGPARDRPGPARAQRPGWGRAAWNFVECTESRTHGHGRRLRVSLSG
jgi:hypothetical protein